MQALRNIVLSDEQAQFVNIAKTGKNILVDACVGSGKTTAIQFLCNELPPWLKILYLTYNKLLKVDAKEKLTNRNVAVTNYHGFAYQYLCRAEVSPMPGQSDLIQSFNRIKPWIPSYDVLVIDEYQDIEEETAELCEYIKSQNPNMQIIAVGDMKQKIYDKTVLDVYSFINQFLGNHVRLNFTRSFRLPSEFALKLGRIWQKNINGANRACKVSEMTVREAIDFLAWQNPQDILCLGSRQGKMTLALNELEMRYPTKFNKKTVYASIQDSDSYISPSASNAIFTTYDSSKGLERNICVVFDFSEEYWGVRANMPMQKYDILRNIFCVAASRGKRHIVFVQDEDTPLTEETLCTSFDEVQTFQRFYISEMFDFKYKEDIEHCYSLLDVKSIETSDTSVIEVKGNDCLIDLSPCVGIFQEALYFENYDIDKDLLLAAIISKQYYFDERMKTLPLEMKVLLLTAIETNQKRYINQVSLPFVTEEEKESIAHRLSEVLTPFEQVQQDCRARIKTLNGDVELSGRTDVIKDDTVFELKFVSELKHEHFLQCACYVAALNLRRGVLWNVKDNTMFELFVPNKQMFFNAVVSAITKRSVQCTPLISKDKTDLKPFFRRGKKKKVSAEEKQVETTVRNKKQVEAPVSKEKQVEAPVRKKKQAKVQRKKFAVIDTETNYNRDAMSIGVIVSEFGSFGVLGSKYYVLEKESKVGGLFSAQLAADRSQAIVTTREAALSEISAFLTAHGVQCIFAYNASFDKDRLPELSSFDWYDIMRIAAYKQYNPKITKNMAVFATGRLQRNYGVQPILRLLSGDKSYVETHNAILDAGDELRIMELLKYDFDTYGIAKIT